MIDLKSSDILRSRDRDEEKKGEKEQKSGGGEGPLYITSRLILL